MHCIRITPTFHDICLAGSAGVMRNAFNVTEGNTHRFGGQGLVSWNEVVAGAVAEMLVAKYLNLFWTGLGIGPEARAAGDVGNVEVRWTPRHDGRLILHDDDDPNKPYVLVTDDLPTYTLQGWAYPREVRKPEYWADPQGKDRWAFFVPQRVLQPMDTLKAVVLVGV